ncbi:MAG: preprotein translocase subunit SecG [Armatimonadota bacterium]|nr:preprotein translocase subunit SecG [Armatimonadota bacterium]MDR7426887.1 preprotein translocase subunit SecG [Armatimonadota bacterium]MDR7470576.1 preprotein translocase subunit SecG [Armatimonadota bacterium]MDR7474152.1 preprotein translocase subunit SecG [Armatimonadota bacterium]MDR7540579.1 preprotein translocase subunit SecG [Armatimonadota bacterium]
MFETMLIVHLVLAMAVIGIVVLQGPKGEGLGAIGGSARLFHGPRPRETLMLRLTTAVSILFIFSATYLVLSR